VKTALLKGRGSYLCLHRMDMARRESSPSDRGVAHALGKIERWSQATRTGDLAELVGLDERSPVLPLVTSTRENCLGAACPQYKACHVVLARKDAMVCDVVVINHHLFFADMAVRESGVAELLPTMRVVIFDEAHQLNETGIQFLGLQLGSTQLLDIAKDMLGTGLQLARGLVDWNHVVAAVERSARDLRLVVGKQAPNARLRWATRAPDGVDDTQWANALDAVSDALLEAAQALATVSEIAPDFARLHERCAQLQARVQAFGEPAAAGSVRWLDAGLALRLVESPLDIAQAVRSRVLKTDATAPAGSPPDMSLRSWVFTSATLGDDAALSWFTEPCGLTDATTLKVQSPFDYASQAAVYVPPHLPRPNDPAHSIGVAALCAHAALALGGRTLMLTTTLRALRVIGDALAERLAGSGLDVLVQGQAPKRELVQRFLAAHSDGAPGCVLVASASFWEGIDLPGAALQLVMIDKLPFPPPNDPLVEARTKRLEEQGSNPFNAYFVPEAAVSLKQGAGRLIRRETDRGLLVLCDTRLTQMGYGKRLLAALPPMRRLQTPDDFETALNELAATHSLISR
jgi:ATP-dependent DNA helicase DinG